MAAAAGTGLLRSVATKMGVTVAPRASSLGLRGRRPWPTSSRRHSSSSSAPSGSTPPTNYKDFTQTKNVPGELHSPRALFVMTRTKRASFIMLGAAALQYFWVKPRLEELVEERNALLRERAILIEALEECKRTHIRAPEQVKDSDGQQAC